MQRQAPDLTDEPAALALDRLRLQVLADGLVLFGVLLTVLVLVTAMPLRPLPVVLTVVGLAASVVVVRMRRFHPLPRTLRFTVVTAIVITGMGPMIAAIGPGPASALSVSMSFMALTVAVVILRGRGQVLAGVGHAGGWLVGHAFFNDPGTDLLLTGAAFQVGALGVMAFAWRLFSGHLVVAETAARSAGQAHERADRVRVEERQRLAEALHDHALQSLLSALQELEEATPGDAAVRAAELRMRGALKALRSLTVSMNDDLLGELAPTVALQHVVAEAASDGRLDITLSVDPDVGRDHTVLLTESARELLQNVRRHARARTVSVTVRCSDDVVELAVEDDGQGVVDADVERALGEGHVGVWRLRRHAEALGGRFTLTARPGGGTRAALEIANRPAVRTTADVA